MYTVGSMPQAMLTMKKEFHVSMQAGGSVPIIIIYSAPFGEALLLSQKSRKSRTLKPETWIGKIGVHVHLKKHWSNSFQLICLEGSFLLLENHSCLLCGCDFANEQKIV